MDRDPPPVVASASSALTVLPSALRESLERRADLEGTIGFDSLVDVALYGPGVGYYTRSGATIGTAGDYYTAPQVHPIFGAVVARRVVEEFERLGRPAGFTLAEIGPGDGTLTATVLEAIGADPRVVDWTVRLVDRSEVLAESARRRVRSAAFPGRFDVQTARSVADGGPFVGIVLGNELLDAQPFRRFVRRPNGWRELGLRLRGGRLEGSESEPLRPVVGPALPQDAPEGTIFEVAEIAEAIVREVADNLLAGSAVFLDYGASQEELIRSRPRGTASAIRGHRIVEDLVGELGRTDLSAFVNFSRLEDAARRAGFEIVRSGVQREALAAWGFEAVLDEWRARSSSTEERLRLDLAAKKILFDFETFRCVELRVPTGRPGGRTESGS